MKILRHTHFIIFSLLFIVLSCGERNRSITNKNPLLGKWINFSNPENYISFDDYKNAIIYINGGERPGNGEVSMKNSNGQYETFIFGPLKYSYYQNGDTIHYKYIGSLNDKLWRRGSAVRDSNILHVWGYKGLTGIENHVDEVALYILEGTEFVQKSSKRITIIIDEGHEGALHIAFNQPSGERPDYDKIGHPIITIETGYIHKTTLKWDPRFMTEDAFDIKIKKCTTGEILDINDYGHTEFRNLARRMRTSDTLKIQDANYSLSAFSLGYNQYARDMIDYEFGEYIQGQVASFSIGYLEDRYNYKEYLRKLEKNSRVVKN